jgi:hypothetical protein
MVVRGQFVASLVEKEMKFLRTRESVAPGGKAKSY